MAEAFGIVAGAITVAAAFNNCVDCFEYIQIGRNFGRDFETCQIRLDLAKVRLSHWGEVANVNTDPRFQEINLEDATDHVAKATLWQILVLFSDSSKVSHTFQPNKTEANTVTQVLDHRSRSLHKKLYQKVKLRQKSIGVFKKFAWAVHQSKELQKLIEDIVKLICELEQLYPGPETSESLRQLAATDIAELEGPELGLISQYGEGINTVLEDAARARAVEIEGNSTGKITLRGDARTRVGDEYSDTAVSTNYSPKLKSSNATGDVEQFDRSRLQVGSRHGGKSLMDD